MEGESSILNNEARCWTHYIRINCTSIGRSIKSTKVNEVNKASSWGLIRQGLSIMGFLKRAVEKRGFLLSFSIVIPLNSPEVSVNYLLISVRVASLLPQQSKQTCFERLYM